MKQFKIILIALLCIVAGNSYGQVVRNSSGSVYTQTHMKTCTPAAVAKSYGLDTLTNGDTGYVWVFVGSGLDLALDLTTTTLTGTVASTSNILYGYNNGGKILTAAQVATVTTTGVAAHAITGNTTYCAGCVGVSSTTVPGALKNYQWQVPNSKGSLYDNYIIRTIQTGTCTATYTGTAQTQY